MKNFWSLVLWYLPAFFTQLIGGWVSAHSLGPWYDQLQKAPWNPPGWVFGPVWTILYILMTVAVWLIFVSKEKKRNTAYILYFVQLFFNGLWPILFFGMRRIDLALWDLGILTIFVGITTVVFYRIRPVSGYLFIPYLLWVAYAFTLNFAIWWLNP